MTRSTNNELPRKTLEQQRAEHAWECVERITSMKGKPKDQFAKHVKQMPVRILTSGLGPALAFLNAKQEATELVDTLNTWIAGRVWAKQTVETDNPNASLMQRIVRGDSNFLRLATDETMAYLQWLVRFAEAKGLKSKN